MPSIRASQDRISLLTAAGLPRDEATDWDAAEPAGITALSSDSLEYSDFWLKSARLIARLPGAARCSEAERAAAATILEVARAARVRFLRHHVETIYDILTERLSRPVRVQHLVTAAADVVPGLVPSPAGDRRRRRPPAARSQRH